jgi:hypothetical protein
MRETLTFRCCHRRGTLCLAQFMLDVPWGRFLRCDRLRAIWVPKESIPPVGRRPGLIC